jgi:methylglutaconyl-CoA hydratase
MLARQVIRRLNGIASTNASRFSSSYVLIERHDDGKIAHLVLNRQEGKNALSAKMLGDFNDAVKELHDDQLVRAIVVKSTVDKVFCAGADLKERATMPDDQVGAFVSKLRGAFNAVSKLPVPTIAAIDGAALGGGLELALACDIRVAGEKALLGLPETSLAIIPGAGGTQRLPRVVGIAKAKELIFTGAKLSPKESLHVGLISEVVEGRSSAERAHEIAQVIAEKGPIATRMAKKAIDEGMQVDLERGLNEVEFSCYGGVVYTSDRKEGLNAFKEKRKPNYQNK